MVSQTDTFHIYTALGLGHEHVVKAWESLHPQGARTRESECEVEYQYGKPFIA